MTKNIIVLFIAAILIGCSSVNSGVVYGTPEWHAERLEELYTAYDNGEITKKEYEEMKESADRVLTKWNATKGVRGISY